MDNTGQFGALGAIGKAKFCSLPAFRFVSFLREMQSTEICGTYDIESRLLWWHAWHLWTRNSVDNLQHLRKQYSQRSPSHVNSSRPFQTFRTKPNGEHVCFVFDVLGHHLDFQAAKYHGGKLPVKAVRKITQQLLLGLDFLHRECGIIHTGNWQEYIPYLSV